MIAPGCVVSVDFFNLILGYLNITIKTNNSDVKLTFHEF